ncbi:OLC1v1014483C1 [Oldenlandia corymbosa var. corymbosa]|uniref:RBR-type E3 ubiquitin transferase n=1 Tax=Oldenlandia corymbosa var. corymbosa TaxID=529605 RepID=A0AAV1E4D7_OLDCO|nr:OLC1v1014483C1 [Oldenlandia corymbosa var. corymbosa]
MAAQENFIDLDDDDFDSSAVLASDVNYAESLQLLEAVMASMMVNDPQIPLNFIQEEQIREEAVHESSLQIVCEICTDSKEIDQTYENRICNHVFCNDCIRQHVEARLEESSTTRSIVCPAVDCKEEIEFHYCQSIMPETLLRKWDKILCESSIDSSQKIYCPFKDCSAMMLMDTEEEVISSRTECFACFRLFCARCSVPWHQSFSCEEYQRLDVNERAGEDLMLKKLAEENSWNRCPRCKYYVEKSEGCIHMTCRCGFQFCYACGATWTEDHGGCQPDDED